MKHWFIFILLVILLLLKHFPYAFCTEEETINQSNSDENSQENSFLKKKKQNFESFRRLAHYARLAKWHAGSIYESIDFKILNEFLYLSIYLGIF
jgi:hypothetical protein